MEFNNDELERILDAFTVKGGEVNLNDLDENIVKRIRTQLKVKKCFYFDDNPNEDSMVCGDKDCDTCGYWRNNF